MECINSSWRRDVGNMVIFISRGHQIARVVEGFVVVHVLLKQDAGRLISARSELTLSKRGDLELHEDNCTCFGVMVVLVGFSLEMAAHIVIPMAEYCLCGLTCIEVASKIMRRKTESQEP